MLRRLVLAGMAAAIIAPIYIITPANAVILGQCTSTTGSATITPGLSHTAKDQTTSASSTFSGCTQTGGGGPTGGSIKTGAQYGWAVNASYPARKLGCPTFLGGVGPDYADQTPIFLSGDPGFEITWSDTTKSHGLVKTKSNGPENPGKVRIVLVITEGHYAPPAGKKTKGKGILMFTPSDTFNCATDVDPISAVTISNVGNFTLSQK